MSARRWSKFWWQDWQRDPALRMCSLAARGAWIEMLCLMADADPVGHLLVNGRAPSMRQLSAVLGCSEKEAKKLVDELEENGVFSRLEDGVIYSRRMVRDKAISDEAAINGKKGGNPQIKGKPTRKVKPNEDKGLTPSLNQEATPPLKHQETEAEADIHLTTFDDAAAASSPKSDQAQTEIELIDRSTSQPPHALPDARTVLFSIGLETVHGLTGKPKTPQCRSLIGKWLKAAKDDASILNHVLLEAAELHPADPVAWIWRAVETRCNPHAVQQRRASAWQQGVMVEGR